MSKIKLLIVDDCEMNRYLLKAMCHDLEIFQIHEAIDGQDAVDQCEKIRPDIILMDIMMPRLDGFQASKQIKERYVDTIIIAVTTMAEVDIEDKITDAGMISYIRKPIDKNFLCQELKSYAKTISIKSM
ncbi:MAG: response regulator [Sulfuricurvum sp.]|nr:response regulator [Sulfuricurvum sp.]